MWRSSRSISSLFPSDNGRNRRHKISFIDTNRHRNADRGGCFSRTRRSEAVYSSVCRIQKKSSPSLGGTTRTFFEEEGKRYWLPRGVGWMERLHIHWETFRRDQQCERVITPNGSFFPLLQKGASSSSSRLARWAEWNPLRGDRWGLFFAQKEFERESISFLHFFWKKVTLFGASFRVFLDPRSEKRVESLLKEVGIPYESQVLIQKDRLVRAFLQVVWVDPIGQEREAGFVRWMDPFLEGYSRLIYASLWGPLAQGLDLLLEQNHGVLPHWMAPEVARILTASPIPAQCIESMQKEGEDRGLAVGFDRRDIPLKEKVRDAERERIPLIAVLGKKEA